MRDKKLTKYSTPVGLLVKGDIVSTKDGFTTFVAYIDDLKKPYICLDKDKDDCSLYDEHKKINGKGYEKISVPFLYKEPYTEVNEDWIGEVLFYKDRHYAKVTIIEVSKEKKTVVIAASYGTEEFSLKEMFDRFEWQAGIDFGATIDR